MTDIVGKHDVVTRDEALAVMSQVTTFTPDEAEAALDLIVSQFTEDDGDVNWSFALDVTLWVYEDRRRVKISSASYGDLVIYHDGEFYRAGGEDMS